jgi:hypothetical protein
MSHNTTQFNETSVRALLTEQLELFEHEQQPLVIEVGPRCIPLRMDHLLFRQTVRAVARQHSEGVALSEEFDAPTREKILAQALLHGLYLPINGHRRTTGIKAALSGDPSHGFKSGTLWGDLKALRCPSPDASLAQKARYVRMRTSVLLLCPMKLLAVCITEFERSVERLSQSRELIVSALSRGIDPLMPQPIGVTPTIGAPRGRPMIRPPIPWCDTDPPLQLARSGSGAFFGMDEIHPTRLGNTMVLGGTGSGKTVNLVIPVLDGLIRYRLASGKRAAVLVIDPKRELAAKVRATLAELGERDRLTVIGEGHPVAFFTQDCPLSPSDRLVKLESFGPGQNDDSQNKYWRDLGQALLRDMIQLAAEYAMAMKGDHLFEVMSRQLGLPSRESRSSWSALRAVLTCARSGAAKLKEVDLMLRRHCESVGITSTSVNALQVYTGDSDLISQFNYVCMSAADTLGAALANPDLDGLVDFDMLPDLSKPRTDLAELMEAGQIVLFSPEMRQGHRIAAMALKAKWYEAVFARSDLERPVGVVIDEAQRFLTNDPETGEQGFLDRCRAYRVITVLTTQSLSSLKYEFGSGAKAQTALDIISANTPSKFIFRSTDVETVGWLRTLIPPPDSGGPHIIDVRRPAGLQPGEAFYLLADGRWGRARADLAGLR